MLNCQKCIETLLDAEQLEVDRIGAAESLMYCASQESKAALLEIILNKSEISELREECAGSLGSICAETEIEYNKLAQIPSQYIEEVLHEIKLRGVILDMDLLKKEQRKLSIDQMY